MKHKKDRIPAKEFARVFAQAHHWDITGLDELQEMLGHRARYLGQGKPTNVNRRLGTMAMNIISSHPVFIASGARPPVCTA